MATIIPLVSSRSGDDRGRYYHVTASSHDSISEDEDAAWQQGEKSSPTKQLIKRIPWLVVFSILLTLVNIAIVFVFPTAAGGSINAHKNKKPLRRASQYFNLAHLNVTPATEMLYNHPIVLAQVSRAEPEKVFPTDTHRYSSFRGMVSPQEKPFLVTHDISTIAQFRMHDFGMERCVIVISVPAQSTSAPGSVDEDHRFIPGGYEIRGDTQTVELWKLEDTQTPLDLHTLSYRTKPRRESLLASVNIAPGEDTRTREFFCAEDSLQTFEFVCPWEDCEARWWQVKGNNTLAVTTLQLPSLAPY